MKTITITLLFLLYSQSKGAKILGIFPVPAPSHYILGSTLMRTLAEKGHDVTFINAFGEKNPPKNGKYRDILLTGFLEAAERKRNHSNLFEKEDTNPFLISIFLNTVMLEASENTLNHPNVQKLIHSNETFDVVITEQFMNDALKLFALHFKAPLILVSTVGANAWVNLLVGNPAPPSYVPALLLSYSHEMTFFERSVNTLMYLFTESLNNFYFFPKHRELGKKYFPDKPDLYDILYNASIVLLNSHPSTNQPVPSVPNMIEVGGYHVKPPKKLPAYLQEFLDNAKDGVIYFSLGSNLKSTNLPKEKREALLKTFSKLKQKVLWKWEEGALPGQPKNVKLGKWFPQQDILAHPNVKLFITHGGLLSTTETIYHGVPVLAIPIFGDQKLNARNIVNNGYGLCLNYKDISEDLLTTKINELLTNPRYAKNAKKKSRIFHDRLVNPLDTAMYWIEYVIRHKGSPHLRVAALELPWYRYFLVDVSFFLLSILAFASYILCKFIKLIIFFCFRKRQEKLKKT